MPTTKILEVKVIDRGWEGIKDRIAALRGGSAVVRVGVQGAEGAANHQGTHLTVAQLAQIHEFGMVIRHPKLGRSTVIPERSFLRATIDKYRDAIARRQVLLTQGYVLGKFEIQPAMELLGQYVVGLIKSRIAQGIAPANSPWTIAKKGSSKPLIDTGQLRNSITYEVVVGGRLKESLVSFREAL